METTDSDRETGTLFLIPTTLGKTPENNTIPEYVLDIIRRLNVLMVENVKSAVRFLQWVGDTVPDYEIEFLLLDKNTTAEEKNAFLAPLLRGEDAGLLSEAGAPAVADPGSEVVQMAHKKDIKIVPLVGPSSILLALMASGFNGQQFSFHGYLPIERHKRKRAIQRLERESGERNQTQIFMEAPHRNDELIEDVIGTCNGSTRFCAAVNLTLPDEHIVSKPVSEWRKTKSESIHKEPAIFLLYAGG